MSRVSEAQAKRKLKIINRQLYSQLQELLVQRDDMMTTHNMFVEFIEEKLGPDEAASLHDQFKEWISKPAIEEEATNDEPATASE